MILYIFIFTLIYLLLYFKSKNRNTNVLLVFFILTLLYGLRNQGGTDDLGYIRDFNNIVSNYPVFGFEITFISASKILGSIGFNYKAVFMLYAIFSFTFMYFAYRELCETTDEWLIAIIGFLVFSFLPTITLMRQFAATTIITYAFSLKHNGYKFKSMVFIFLASLFHFPAILTIAVFPFVSFKHIRTSAKIAIPIIALIIGYFGFLNILFENINFIIPKKYLVYLLDPRKLSIGVLHTILFAIYLLQMIIPLFLARKEYKNPKIEFLERMQLIYFSFYFLTLSSGWINRMSIYFILFLPFIFITFAYRFTSKDKKIILQLCYFACFILYVYTLLGIPENSSYMNLIPYQGSFDFRK